MAANRPIVLLTDFGTRDAYVASMKGVIATVNPGACVTDLTHEIGPQNVKQASFVLEAAYRYFPQGSIFVSVVDPGVGSERRILAVRSKRGIFLAPDNGLLTRVLEREAAETRIVNNRKFFLDQVSATFHGRDCFAPTAARLAKNPGLFSRLGPLTRHVKRLSIPMARVRAGRLEGEIIYFDHFGNAFANISRSDLECLKSGKKIQVRVRGRNIGPVQKSYFEAAKGKPVAVISSTGVLEIAVNQGSARQDLKLKERDKVEAVTT